MRNLMSLLLLALAATASAADSFISEASIYKVESKNVAVSHIGTGVLIAPNRILTNCHIIGSSKTVKVTHQKSGQQFLPRSLHHLGNLDACVLIGYFTAGAPATLNDSYKIGQTVWHFGYPQGVYGSSKGPLLGLVKITKGQVFESASLDSALFCSPGSSGGPLFNASGQLIGLNFGIRSAGKAFLCLSIPVFKMRPYLDF